MSRRGAASQGMSGAARRSSTESISSPTRRGPRRRLRVVSEQSCRIIIKKKRKKRPNYYPQVCTSNLPSIIFQVTADALVNKINENEAKISHLGQPNMRYINRLQIWQYYHDNSAVSNDQCFPGGQTKFRDKIHTTILRTCYHLFWRRQNLATQGTIIICFCNMDIFSAGPYRRFCWGEGMGDPHLQLGLHGSHVDESDLI